MSRTYTRGPCWYCGQIVSSNGWATARHEAMHANRGEIAYKARPGRGAGLVVVKPPPDWRQAHPHGWEKDLP